MKIDLKTGLLMGPQVQYLPSPHQNNRPEAMPIELLVIHGISLPPEEFGQDFVQSFFCGTLDHSLHPYFETLREVRVSAHLFIDRAGRITQFVPFSERAWHAGLSAYQDRFNCNDFSIGIELEGTDHTPYEKIQYESLVLVVKLLQNAYPGITRERIVGHEHIAPGRKTDPGPSFDWAHFDRLLSSKLEMNT